MQPDRWSLFREFFASHSAIRQLCLRLEKRTSVGGEDREPMVGAVRSTASRKTISGRRAGEAVTGAAAKAQPRCDNVICLL